MEQLRGRSGPLWLLAQLRLDTGDTRCKTVIVQSRGGYGDRPVSVRDSPIAHRGHRRLSEKTDGWPPAANMSGATWLRCNQRQLLSLVDLFGRGSRSTVHPALYPFESEQGRHQNDWPCENHIFHRDHL